MPEEEVNQEVHEQESEDQSIAADEQEATGDEAEATADDTGSEEEAQTSPDDEQASRTEQAYSRLERALNRFEQAANRASNDPSDKNVQAAAREKSRLEKLVESEDLDIDPSKAIKEIANESLDLQKQQGETTKQYEARIQRLEQQLAQQSNEMRKAQFDQMHPELKGKYDELTKQAYGKVEHVLSQLDESSPQVAVNMAQEMLGQAFESVMHEAKSKVKDKSGQNGKAKSEKKSPKGTNPVAGSAAKGNTGNQELSLAQRLYGNKKQKE